MAASDIKQDHDSVLIDQVPESVNSPANSDTSSSSSNSSLSSSTASDINDLENGAAEENISLQEVDNDDEDEKNDATASPPQNLIPSHRDLNGIVTFNTSPIHSSSIASPPSSDPEEDLHDLHGDENDIQASSIDEYAPEARVHSLTNPSSRITAVMQSSSAVLWKQFDALGTEMIVTRRGRRMFPPLKVELFDLDPNTTYTLYMDMVPVDKYRYKYQNSAWVRCFEEECSPTRLYMHPDSPALGSHWKNMVINFYKLKLTNNSLDKQGHIIVNSMHKYEPRLHVVETSHMGNVNKGEHHMFVFPRTQFMTVTAYQNDKITQLKIENNPFAKGFRPPFSRCRGRNQQQRIALHSTGSESSEDSLSVIQSSRSVVVPTTAFNQRQEILIVNHGKRTEHPSSEVPSQKRVCLATATSPKEQSPINMCAPQKAFTRLPSSCHSHHQLVTVPMFTTQATVGGTRPLSLVQASNSPTLIQTPTLIPTTSGTPVNILQATPSRPHTNGCFIPMTANGIAMSNGHTPMNLIQTVAGQTLRVIPQSSLANSTHQPVQVINAAVNLDQAKFPPTTTTVISSSSVKGVTPSPSVVARATNEKNVQIRRSLSSTSSPPPLVQVKTEANITHKSCSPPPPPPHSMMTLKLPQQGHAFETTTAPAATIPINTMQSIILPTTSLQQPGRLLLIAADGSGALESNAAGAIAALPVKSVVDAGHFAQNSFGHSFVPVQLLKIPSNTITTA